MTVNISNGLSFVPLARLKVPCETTLAYDDKRIVLNGYVAIDLQKGSTKFGPQLQIHVFTHQTPRFEERRENKKFTRVEVAMPVQEGFDFLNEAVNMFREEKRQRHHSQPFAHGKFREGLRT